MKIDITNCVKINIIDSCAVSNILSSLVLYNTLDENSFSFSTTKYVDYECLVKARTIHSKQDSIFRNRLLKQKQQAKFSSYDLTIEDLQDSEILSKSQNLGIGELSCIAFCKKTNQVFLSDDQNARKIAETILGSSRVQTVPHLLGWLFYKNFISDADLEPIIKEHNYFGRPLEKYFREVYEEALRIKCSFGRVDLE